MSFLFFLAVYVIGALIVAAIGLTVTAVLEGSKVKSLDDLVSLDAEIVFRVSIFWPLPFIVGLPIVLFGGFTYGLFRFFQWIAFEIFKPKENV